MAVLDSPPPIGPVLDTPPPIGPIIPPPIKASEPTPPSALRKAFGLVKDIGSEFWKEAAIEPGQGSIVKNTVMAVPEATRAVLQNLGGQIIAGYAGMGTGIRKLFGADVDPGKVVEDVEAATHYEPSTTGGRVITQAVSLPFTALSATGKVTSEDYLELYPDSPAAAAAIDLLPQALGIIAMGKSGDDVSLTESAKAAPIVKQGIDRLNARDAKIPMPEPVKAEEGVIDQAPPIERENFERRVNAELRARFEELRTTNPDALFKEYYTDKLTGLQNSRAFESTPASPVVAVVDADNMKFYNDHYTHIDRENGGNGLILRVGKALQQVCGEQAFRAHKEGDEFYIRGQTTAELEAKLHQVAGILQKQPFDDGSAPTITWGMASHTDPDVMMKNAEEALLAAKDKRLREGKRVKSGEQPLDYKGPDFSKRAKEAAQALDFSDLEDELSPPPKEISGPPTEKPEEGEPDFKALAVQGRLTVRDVLNAKVEHLKDMIQQMFPGKEGLSEMAAAVMAREITRVSQVEDAIRDASRPRRRVMARLNPDEQLAFIHAIQTGKDVSAPLKPLADFYRKRYAEQLREEHSVKVDVNEWENYFAQQFMKPKAAKGWLDLSKSQAEVGSKQAFQMHRYFKYFTDGIAAGLKPISMNPEDLFMMREAAHAKVMKQGYALNALRDNGLIRVGDHADPGEVVIKLPDGRTFIAPENIANMIHNGFFSKSLWTENTPAGYAFRAVMEGKMIISPIMLGLFSLFHPVHLVLGVKTASAAANAMRTFVDHPVTEESIAEVSKSFGKSLVSYADFGPIQFKNLRDAWLGRKVDLTPEEAKAQKYLVAGGMRPITSREYTGLAKEKFLAALDKKNLGAMAVHVVPTMLRGIVAPVMEYYVPYLKVQDYLGAVYREVLADPTLDEEGLRQTLAFSRIRRQTDERFGELPFDLQFWNRRVTEAMQASALSYSWNYGFVKQFGGGAYDIARMVARTTSKDKAKTYISSRAVYAMMYIGYSAFLCGLATKLLSGQNPQEIKDLIYPVYYIDPKTGKKYRITTPFFTREFGAMYYRYQAEGPKAFLDMLSYKANPIFSLLAEQYQNENYFGQQISDPLDSWPDRLGERAKAAFMHFTPLALQSAFSGNVAPGHRAEAVVMGILGFNQAPGYVGHAPLIEKIYAQYDVYDKGMQPYSSVAETLARRQLRGLYQAGKMDDFNAAFMADTEKFQWTEAGVRDFAKSLSEPEGAYEFQKLPAHVQVDLLQHEMTPEQVQQYLPLASIKARLALQTR